MRVCKELNTINEKAFHFYHQRYYVYIFMLVIFRFTTVYRLEFNNFTSHFLDGFQFSPFGFGLYKLFRLDSLKHNYFLLFEDGNELF